MLEILKRGLRLLDIVIEWAVIALMVSLVLIVSLQFSHLPTKIRHVLELAFDALLIVLLVVLVPGSWRLMVIGKDQELLGTVFSAAVPAAGVFIACVVMLLYVSVRLVAGVMGRKPPGYEEK